MSETLPALFVGHGNPMLTLGDNAYARAWRALGGALPRPKAVLAISAHWYVRDTRVTTAETPETIHDFGGFPRELFEILYPAPGSPALAQRVIDLLAPVAVLPDADWGLDHGSWTVLRHLYPEADVPVVQLSIDATQPPAFHLDLGRRLAPLRDEGVLLFGSGNIVHNLRAFDWSGAAAPQPWAERFDAWVADCLLGGAFDRLTDWGARGEDGRLAVPTPDHYLPLLYVAGAARPGDAVGFPVTGFDGGTMSMRAVRIG